MLLGEGWALLLWLAHPLKYALRNNNDLHCVLNPKVHVLEYFIVYQPEM